MTSLKWTNSWKLKILNWYKESKYDSPSVNNNFYHKKAKALRVKTRLVFLFKGSPSFFTFYVKDFVNLNIFVLNVITKYVTERDTNQNVYHTHTHREYTVFFISVFSSKRTPVFVFWEKNNHSFTLFYNNLSW